MDPRPRSLLPVWRISLIITSFLLAVGLTAKPACAQTTATWNGGTGNWTTASRWGCPSAGINCVPGNGTTSGATYYVAIDAGNVLLNSSSTQASVTIDAISTAGTLSIYDGESLTAVADFSNNGDLFVGAHAYSGSAGIANGSSLTVGGNLTNTGALQVGNGAVSGTVTANGTFNNTNGQIDLLGGNTSDAQSTLSVAGAAPSTLDGYLLDGFSPSHLEEEVTLFDGQTSSNLTGRTSGVP